MKSLSEEHLAILRRHMVEVIDIQFDLMSEEIGGKTLNERVRSALQNVPRHRFVPQALAPLAYHDTPLPIGFDKTVSQPFIAALMVELLKVTENDVVLEIGTGLGYQAALMAQLAAQVWTVEIVEEFAETAKLRLQKSQIENVGVRVGDGSRGWAEHAPFDKILVTAATRQPPAALVQQLKPGGRMILPLGPPEVQQLTVLSKSPDDTVKIREITPVRFTQLEVG